MNPFNLITVNDLVLSIFFFAFPFIFVHWAMIINFCFISYTNFKGWNYKIGCFGPLCCASCNTYKRSDAGKVGQKKHYFFVCHMAAAALRFCMRKLMIPKDWDNKTYNHNNHNKYLTVGNMYITSILKIILTLLPCLLSQFALIVNNCILKSSDNSNGHLIFGF